MKVVSLILAFLLPVVLVFGLFPTAQADDNNTSVNLTAEVVPPPPPPGPGGGGGGGAPCYLKIDMLGNITKVKI